MTHVYRHGDLFRFTAARYVNGILVFRHLQIVRDRPECFVTLTVIFVAYILG